MAAFKDPERGFEDAPRIDRPSSTITDENIEAVERIVMHDRQISVHHVAYELGIAKTCVHEIGHDKLEMKKVCTRWVPEFLTPVQRANRVDSYEELLQQRKANSTDYFDYIVTVDESWIHHYDPLCQFEAR